MNLLLLQHPDLTTPPVQPPTPPETPKKMTGEATISGERHQHLRKILRAKVGDQLRTGYLNGPIGQAKITALTPSTTNLSFHLTEPPPKPLAVRLLLALPRPKFLGRILQHATTIGVKQIELFNSARVEKSYWGSNLLDPKALHRHLCLGLEQGKDTLLPSIHRHHQFADLITALKENRASDLLIADATGSRGFPCEAPSSADLVIGPEGGLLAEEIASLGTVGGQVVSLGPRPLRVEAAVSVCLGRLLPAPGQVE